MRSYGLLQLQVDKIKRARKYTRINIITLLIRLRIIAVTVITAVILIIIFTIYAVTVILGQEIKISKITIVFFVDVALRAAFF